MPPFLVVALLFYSCGLSKCEDDTIISNLQARLLKLEERDEQQREAINVLQKKHDNLAEEHETMKVKVGLLEQRDQENTELISSQRTELERINLIMTSRPVKAHGHKTSSSSAETMNLSSRHVSKAYFYEGDGKIHQTHSRRFLLNGAETVAFHATFAEDKIIHNLSVGSTIPFTTVRFNIGGGYHPSTSVFIAPIGGVYIFSTSIMSEWLGLHSLHVGIMKNGTYLAGAYSTGDNTSAEQGSVTVTTQLKLGDEVWVKHIVHENASVYGGSLTSFMGCLITPL